MRAKKMNAMSVPSVKRVGFTLVDPQVPGLYLKVTPLTHGGGFSRSWSWRYNSPLTGARRWLGLGSIARITLAEAKKLANDYWKVVYIEKRDIIDEQKQIRVAALKSKAKAMTFKECWKRACPQITGKLKNAKHVTQWHTSIEKACAVFGKLPVQEVEQGHVMKVIAPDWERAEESAWRTLGRIERVLDWATASGFRQGQNPASWEIFKHLLPRKSKAQVKHHAALAWQDLPAFVQDLRDRDSMSARALEFTILTAARTGETIGATWGEFDLDQRIWTAPGTRTKSGRDHRVPLCDKAVSLLQGLKRGSAKDRVFALSNMAMLQLAKGMRPGTKITTHGFRSSFSDWARDSGYPRDTVEMCLAHVVKDKTEAAYRRGDDLERRRRVMQAWCKHCSTPMPSTAKVLNLKRA
jgi:integrase